MKKSFITIGGVEYRVEVNWNALSNFLKATDRDTLEGLSNISDMRPSDMAPLMAAAINEGERLEGRSTNLSAETLGESLRPSHIAQFMDIYIEQSVAQVEPETAKKKEDLGEQ